MTCINHTVPRHVTGRECLVGTATLYGLYGPGIESRLEARFYTPVQTGPGAHPASSTMGTGSCPGVQRPGRGVDNPIPSSAEVKERVELCLYPTLGLHGLFTGELYLYLILAIYPAHRNILHFTAVSTPADLYKSHSSSLRNINPSYTPSPS